MKNEYRLLLLTAIKNRNLKEEEELKELFSKPLNWEIIGGQIINHRLGGYFLSGLNEEYKERVPEEFLKALELIKFSQRKQTIETIKLLKPILEDFEKNNVRYAGLKGIILNANMYNLGDRRSNDADLLVVEEDLENIDKILRNHGYIQTLMKNGEYKEASRREKLIQRMNYHDLVPYVKLLDNEFIKESEIDINFHFDSKDNDITEEVYNYGTEIYKNDLYNVRGLPWETNLAHLCVHFYREGTNSIWTKGKRDVLLYKIIDIINVFKSCDDEKRINEWINLIHKFKLEKQVYFTFYMISQLYENELMMSFMEEIKPEDTSYMFEIKIEGEHRIVKRTEKFVDSIFNLIFE